MFAVCWIVFFATVRQPEQVMVPNVVGKDLTNALLEMQVKELYPKIQLRYTDNPDDAGKILNQSPDGGAIVKAGRRITLTVSRGVILDHVENYIGQNYDDVKINLQTMFTGSKRPLIVLAEPSYKADRSDAGTILAQDPPEGTTISNPVTVKLIVSRGPEYDNAKVPNIQGMSIGALLKVMETSKLVFEFTTHVAGANEEPGVSAQEKSESTYLPNYARVYADLALPAKPVEDEVYGLFTTSLPSYPYPVAMTLESVGKDGTSQLIVSLNHTGGNVTIPYISEKGRELVLSVAGKKTVRKMVE
ncbi:MAG: PASTA domain-containing protein [Treponema sp.]|nr:PASTA domain-containing protein [Candidatus Treponema equifaecale]